MGKTINILIAIDTESVRANYPNPARDSNKPTGIARNLGYMVATGTKVNSGQGTGDLSVSALAGDTVRIFATSGSDNFDDAVLLYGISKFSGVQVFSAFNYRHCTRPTVAPQSIAMALPARIVEEEFWFYQAGVIAKGKEGQEVRFALYFRDQDTSQPGLLGYYSWHPEITVAY